MNEATYWIKSTRYYEASNYNTPYMAQTCPIENNSDLFKTGNHMQYKEIAGT